VDEAMKPVSVLSMSDVCKYIATLHIPDTKVQRMLYSVDLLIYLCWDFLLRFLLFTLLYFLFIISFFLFFFTFSFLLSLFLFVYFFFLAFFLSLLLSFFLCFLPLLCLCVSHAAEQPEPIPPTKKDFYATKADIKHLEGVVAAALVGSVDQPSEVCDCFA
jgi:hypothetical protein